ncbi:hypothetical protein [Streptomyces sp. NBC_00827]|uniref:hypothetical protein n=1 Tax=Streptomyces sp. NBC_00827 TaxID=2903677 RepID=UPI003869B3C7|nr:hypothetical protein OG569_10175 [Streptomyces sp. NBC_00827]
MTTQQWTEELPPVLSTKKAARAEQDPRTLRPLRSALHLRCGRLPPLLDSYEQRRGEPEHLFISWEFA